MKQSPLPLQSVKITGSLLTFALSFKVLSSHVNLGHHPEEKTFQLLWGGLLALEHYWLYMVYTN
jgi:hypothetical protein